MDRWAAREMTYKRLRLAAAAGGGRGPEIVPLRWRLTARLGEET
jgi:hypothetical protein